jgi:hypothetical protein
MLLDDEATARRLGERQQSNRVNDLLDQVGIEGAIVRQSIAAAVEELRRGRGGGEVEN